MSDFAGRLRMTRAAAEAALARPSNMVAHLVDNGDGTYSVLYHIVCEFCDYCAEGGAGPFRAREDPYEAVGREVVISRPMG